ncbi:MAG: methionyl-tRNA formyltransferase [Candidatus Omnitrophica bacterium]|nr:methionyl-tRNA formyltransferase [Candidatus Omnitrophota bacterium]
MAANLVLEDPALKIVFFGSDDFAAAHLQALLTSEHRVVGCVTQPDKPQDRGMKVAVSPVKTAALQQGVPVLQPEDIKDARLLTALTNLAADLFLVIAYGRFLPDTLLALPRLGAINVHGSLLPKYRGAAPINWAIINGETETGLTLIKMNPQMDAGEILAQHKMQIAPDETAVSLRERMKQAGPGFLLTYLREWEALRLAGKSQDPNAVTFAPKLYKENGRMDWARSAVELERLVRGLQPWPCAHTTFKGKLLKILRAAVVPGKAAKPGQIFEIQKAGFLVGTGREGLLISVVHPESSRLMEAADFIHGCHLSVDDHFE